MSIEEIGLVVSATAAFGTLLHGFSKSINNKIDTRHNELKHDVGNMKRDIKSDMGDMKHDIKSEIKAELHSELKVVNHALTNIKAQQAIFSEGFKQIYDARIEEKVKIAEMQSEFDNRLKNLEKERKVS